VPAVPDEPDPSSRTRTDTLAECPLPAPLPCVRGRLDGRSLEFGDDRLYPEMRRGSKLEVGSRGAVRGASFGIGLAVMLVACGGGESSLSKYAANGEELTTRLLGGLHIWLAIPVWSIGPSVRSASRSTMRRDHRCMEAVLQAVDAVRPRRSD